MAADIERQDCKWNKGVYSLKSLGAKHNNYPLSVFCSDSVIENSDIEKFHNKYALNMSKRSSSSVARFELGRTPIRHNAFYQGINYWHRLEKGTFNVFVNSAFVSTAIMYHFMPYQYFSLFYFFSSHIFTCSML